MKAIRGPKPQKTHPKLRNFHFSKFFEPSALYLHFLRTAVKQVIKFRDRSKNKKQTQVEVEKYL